MPVWYMEVKLNFYLSFFCFFFFFFISINLILSSCDCTNIATDISGSNIAFTCSQWSSATKKDLFKILGTPQSDKLVRLDGKPLDKALPKYLVEATEWFYWADEGIEDLRLIDLGESFLQRAEPTRLAQPPALKVPETIFAESFDHRVDLWRAGCVVPILQKVYINYVAFFIHVVMSVWFHR